MKCPVCRDPDLVMTDRQGIEIDYCPQCRGVWLDRGELDKIIERSSVAPNEEYRGEYREEPGYRQGGGDFRHSRKRKSPWKELFDF